MILASEASQKQLKIIMKAMIMLKSTDSNHRFFSQMCIPCYTCPIYPWKANKFLLDNNQLMEFH